MPAIKDKVAMRTRTYSAMTKDAVLLLGKQIKLARKKRGLTEAGLAERVGVSRSTIRAVESGRLVTEIGLVFEAAVIAGVDLFQADGKSLTHQLARFDDKLALLSRRVRVSAREPNDDF